MFSLCCICINCHVFVSWNTHCIICALSNKIFEFEFEYCLTAKMEFQSKGKNVIAKYFPPIKK